MKSKQLNYSQLISLVLAESRGAWKRMAFFILCIAIGVGVTAQVEQAYNLGIVTTAAARNAAAEEGAE